MIVIPTVTELSLIGVADRGVPNKERVVLRPSEAVELGEFALITVVSREDGVIPLIDSFFWFGQAQAHPPGWVYVYTGPGTNTTSQISGTGVPVRVFHWGRKNVVFTGDRVHPALIRLGGIGFGAGGYVNAPLTVEEMNAFFRTLSPPATVEPKILPPPGPPAWPAKK